MDIPNLRRSESSITYSVKPRCIIQFISVEDAPLYDAKHKPNLFVKAVIFQKQPGENNGSIKLECISEAVYTTVRDDCRSVTWNCFRDFRINPPADAIIMVRVCHTPSEHQKLENHIVLGTAEIPLSSLTANEEISCPITPLRVSEINCFPLIKVTPYHKNYLIIYLMEMHRAEINVLILY